MSTPPSVVILGGGFGGLQTALRLSQFPWPQEARPQILLIDQNSHFLFLPLLYELVTNELETWEIAPPFSELLANTEIQFRQGKVESIDLEAQRITLQSGDPISYDRLILALGSETPLDIVPGAAEYALPFHSVDHAHQLKDRLRLLEASEKDAIRVAVVGGGASGVELACKLADRLGDRGQIRLVERANRLLQQSPDYNRVAAQKSLEQRGVWIDLETTIRQITPTELQTTYKGQEDTLRVDLVLWTVGNAIAPVIQALPVPHSPEGRVTTTVTLQVTDHANIFALGDLADCRDANGVKVPTTAQSAIQQADCVAWNIWASLNQRTLLPFRYTHLGEMLTLGTDSAALAGLGITLDGPFAYLARRLIYLYRMPTLEHQLKVGLNWLTKPLLTVFGSPSP